MGTEITGNITVRSPAVESIAVNAGVGALMAEIMPQIQALFQAEFHKRPENAKGGDYQRAFQAVFATALMRQAAIVSIDAGMPAEVFAAIGQEQFETVTNDWPTWGE